MIQVNVTYRFSDKTNRDAFMAELYKNDIPAKTNAENGCFCYNYFYPVDKDNEVFLLEQWEDAEAVAVHATQPHFLLLQEIKAKLVESTEIVKLKAEKM